MLNTCSWLWLTESDQKTPSHGLNKGHGSKFCVGSQVRRETLESRRAYQLKCCEYNNKDEDNTLKTLNDKKWM